MWFSLRSSKSKNRIWSQNNFLFSRRYSSSFFNFILLGSVNNNSSFSKCKTTTSHHVWLCSMCALGTSVYYSLWFVLLAVKLKSSLIFILWIYTTRTSRASHKIFSKHFTVCVAVVVLFFFIMFFILLNLSFSRQLSLAETRLMRAFHLQTRFNIYFRW